MPVHKKIFVYADIKPKSVIRPLKGSSLLLKGSSSGILPTSAGGLLKKHNTLLRLLFFRAQGSSLGNYKETFAERSTKLVKQYFLTIKGRHPEVNIEISGFYIQLHTVWMFALLEEIVRQRVKPEDIEQIITEYMTGEIFGWRKLMKI